MSSGSRSSPKQDGEKRTSRPRTGPKRSRSKRRPGRDRVVLLSLLAAIALLLGILIWLLPDAPPASGDGPGAVAREESRGPGPAEGEDTGTTADAQDDPSVDTQENAGRDGSAGREERANEIRPGVEGGVTESYPADERPERAPADTDDELWWLPEQDVLPDERGPLVLVIDDAGNTLDGYERFLAFPGHMTIAVLPQLDYSVQAAAMAAAASKEILLHQPMEAEGGLNPGPGAIASRMGEPEIARRLAENLATVPGAVGVNNHMGSAATAQPAVMLPLLQRLHERGLFFLDSRTSAATVGRSVAAEVGIPFAERKVFLDNERTRESILESLGHALELSHEGEAVVMIGHATVPVLADVLAEVYPLLGEYGYRFARLSELVEPVRVAAGADS